MAGSTWRDPAPNLRPTGLGQETGRLVIPVREKAVGPRGPVIPRVLRVVSHVLTPMKKISFSLFPPEY